MKKSPIRILSVLLILISLWAVITYYTESEAKVRKISDVVKVLKESGNEPIVLKGKDQNKVVIVTPELVGRVLCTGLDGVEGNTESYIDENQIRKGATKSEPAGKWSSFGGEERIWFAPEGGKFGLFYRQNKAQDFPNYLVPEPLNSTQYKVIENPSNGKSVTFSAPIQLVNYQGTSLNLEVVRKVEILESCPYTLGLSDKIESVGFETNTWVKNTGDQPFTRQEGAVGVWTLGQFPAKQNSVIMVPFRSGSDSALGPVLNTEYFNTDMIDTTKAPSGHSYDDYWKVAKNVALVKASGSVQTKIEMNPKRAMGKLASVDLKNSGMTIVEFRMYPELAYTASYWLPYDGDPYDGASISVFVLSKEVGVPPFYELEVISPALFLQPNEQYRHISRTYHLRGDIEAMMKVCELHFNTDSEMLRKFNANAP